MLGILLHKIPLPCYTGYSKYVGINICPWQTSTFDISYFNVKFSLWC